ncbi:hypothetical protein EYF80_050888 [Liparis tanakae]|uniref:Uncharacterized protein n=1 Tax=Liparis tanakae TaxID=230148 RepID=A0A4Z2FEW9_9TELE|nr:hypothetical protein EYF80_050888 [Liparis tanakae]
MSTSTRVSGASGLGPDGGRRGLSKCQIERPPETRQFKGRVRRSYPRHELARHVSPAACFLWTLVSFRCSQKEKKRNAACPLDPAALLSGAARFIAFDLRQRKQIPSTSALTDNGKASRTGITP